MEEMGIVYIVFALIWSIIWGVIVKKVIENKGYYENWFWWGFFFGWIALIVALTKPNVDRSYNYRPNSLLTRLENSDMKPGEVRDGNWKCACGLVNPIYTGTCACGKNRQGLQESKRKSEQESYMFNKSESVTESIKKYKELLDIGAITEAEFEAKKKELLNL